MYEIVVIKDKVYRYPFKWSKLTDKVKETAKRHRLTVVSVWKNGQWFCDKYPM